MEFKLQSLPARLTLQAYPLMGSTALSQTLDPNKSGLPAIAPLLLDLPNADLVKQLCENNADYVSHMLRQLAGQLKNGEEIVREYFSETDGIILNAGCIAKVCLLFDGFFAT